MSRLMRNDLWKNIAPGTRLLCVSRDGAPNGRVLLVTAHALHTLQFRYEGETQLRVTHFAATSVEHDDPETLHVTYYNATGEHHLVLKVQQETGIIT